MNEIDAKRETLKRNEILELLNTPLKELGLSIIISGKTTLKSILYEKAPYLESRIGSYDYHILKKELNDKGISLFGDHSNLNINYVLLSTPVNSMPISTRAKSALNRVKVYNLGDLLTINFSTLSSIRNVGEQTIAALKSYIHSLGFKFQFEYYTAKELRDELEKEGYTLLEKYFQTSTISTPLYNQGIFTIDALLEYGPNALNFLCGKAQEDVRKKLKEMDLSFKEEKTEKHINLEIQERIERKTQTLIEYEALMSERQRLLQREKELDELIDKKIKELQDLRKGVTYEKKL